jgi:hypothetical protein
MPIEIKFGWHFLFKRLVEVRVTLIWVLGED